MEPSVHHPLQKEAHMILARLRVLQRYKHEIRTEDRQPLKELLRRQYHPQVQPRGESVVSGTRVSFPRHSTPPT